MAVELSRDAQRWLTRLPEIVNIALVILIALSAAQLFWLLWPGGGDEVAAPTSPASLEESERRVDIDSIANANLFGQPQSQNAGARQQREIIDAPETRLNLTLTGIISESNGERSRALIKSGNRQQEGYAVGDDVGDGVGLHAIYANRVILDRNGQFETLTLESVKQTESFGGVERSDAISNDLADDLSEVRQQILANPSNASRYIRLQPERQNGSLVGYRIFPGADRALFDQAGLQPGELVTAIDGQPLSNPASSLRLLSGLATADRATVTLERNGRQRTVTVNF